MNRIFSIVLAISLISLNACHFQTKPTAKKITLPVYYSDHMVVPHGKAVLLEGSADPNSTIAVRIERAMQFVQADHNGKWSVEFPPVSLSEPFSLFVEGADTLIEIRDVVQGELVFAGGDGFEKYKGLLDSAHVAPMAEIRIFSFDYASYNESLNGFERGAWIKAPVEKLPSYLVPALEWHEKLVSGHNMPVGLVNAIYPGAEPQAWLGAHKDSLELDSLVALSLEQEFGFQTILDTSYAGIEKRVSYPRFDDEYWRMLPIPFTVERRPNMLNKIVWLRKKIFISTKYMTSDFRLELGKVNMHAEVYFNEKFLGEIHPSGEDLEIIIPDSIIKIWTNVLALRVPFTEMDQGFYAEEMRAYNMDSSYFMRIHKDWKYKDNLEVPLPELYHLGQKAGSLNQALLNELGGKEYAAVYWLSRLPIMEDTVSYPQKKQEIINAVESKLTADSLIFLPMTSLSYYDSVKYSKRLEVNSQ